MDLLANRDAESNLLGSLLIENDKFIEIPELKAIDFYWDNHKIIFSTMQVQYSKGKHFDEVVLCTQMGKEDLEKCGGITYIMNLSQSVASTRMIKEYAKIIKELSLKRDIVKFTKEVENSINIKPIKEIATSMETELNKISRTNVKEDGEINCCLQELVSEIEKRHNRGGGITGISSGFKATDRATNGLNKQDFIILAARPSMGKTTVAIQMALNIALKEKKNVAFFSLEMSKTSLLGKIVSNLGLIEFGKLTKGEIDDNGFIKMTNAADKVTDLNLKIYEQTNNISDIKMECKKLKMQNKLDIVFIDYLQRIVTDGKFQNDSSRVSYISGELKQIAKELDIPLICLSQLSRAPELRPNHKPELSDLRDSGSIEQDADIVMMLYRDAYYNEDTERPNIIDVFIDKNRQGEIGHLELAWKPEYCKVTDLAYPT